MKAKMKQKREKRNQRGVQKWQKDTFENVRKKQMKAQTT